MSELLAAKAPRILFSTLFGLRSSCSQIRITRQPVLRSAAAIIFEIITKLTRSKDVLRLEYDPDFLNILENRSAESVSALLGNLKRIAAQQDSPALAKEVFKAEKQLKRLSKAKEEAEAGEARELEAQNSERSHRELL